MSDKKQLSGWKRFLQSMTKAHDLGSEEEILTDHDYDGIKELDNVLPPWWKYGFYITIAIGIFYYIQVFTNSEEYSQEKEYAAEVEKGKQEVEAYKAANPELFKLDITLLTDEASLAAGKKILTPTVWPAIWQMVVVESVLILPMTTGFLAVVWKIYLKPLMKVEEPVRE